MPEYKLKFTEDETDIDESRKRTMEEISAFVELMNGKPLAMVTLDETQSMEWDQEGDVDYQDVYGRQIVEQVNDGITESLVIRNVDGLPVALGIVNGNVGWQGLGIDKRLRMEIATMLQNDEAEFE